MSYLLANNEKVIIINSIGKRTVMKCSMGIYTLRENSTKASLPCFHGIEKDMYRTVLCCRPHIITQPSFLSFLTLSPGPGVLAPSLRPMSPAIRLVRPLGGAWDAAYPDG